MSYYDNTETVKIPIRIVDGKMECFYGGELPKIEEGTIGELVIPEYGVKDKIFIEKSQRESEQELLPKNRTIMIAISHLDIKEDKINHTESINAYGYPNSAFIKVELLGPLNLLIRGSKKSKLVPVKCEITSLEKVMNSLNSAYTFISEQFEPHRTSHTGNIFSKAYYEVNGIWFPLDKLRSIKEEKAKEKLFLNYRDFELNKDFDKNLNWDYAERVLIELMSNGECLYEKEIIEMYKENNEYSRVIQRLIENNVIREVK